MHLHSKELEEFQEAQQFRRSGRDDKGIFSSEIMNKLTASVLCYGTLSLEAPSASNMCKPSQKFFVVPREFMAFSVWEGMRAIG